MNLFQKWFGPADPWKRMHGPFVETLRARLSGVEQQSLTRLLRKHRLLHEAYFGREIGQRLETEWKSPSSALGIAIMQGVFTLTRQDEEALQLCTYAQTIDPDCGSALALMAVLLLKRRDLRGAAVTAAKALPLLEAMKRTLVDSCGTDRTPDQRSSLDELRNLQKQMRAIKEGRVTLGAYRALLDETCYGMLSSMVKDMYEGAGSDPLVSDGELILNPADGLTLANEIMGLFIACVQGDGAPSLVHFHSMAIGAALDPDRWDLRANAAIGYQQCAVDEGFTAEERANCAERAVRLAAEALAIIQAQGVASTGMCTQGGGPADGVLEQLRSLARRTPATPSQDAQPG